MGEEAAACACSRLYAVVCSVCAGKEGEPVLLKDGKSSHEGRVNQLGHGDYWHFEMTPQKHPGAPSFFPTVPPRRRWWEDGGRHGNLTLKEHQDKPGLNCALG